jgi:hypothetical protein
VPVHFGAGQAELRVNNLPIEDYHFLANAIGPNFNNDMADDPAVVSFDVVWSGPITRRVSVTNGALGDNYAGQFVENQVTVTWSGTNLATGFSFTANPGTLATSTLDGGFSELGKERNGILFGPSSTDTASRILADAVLPRGLAAWPANSASTKAALVAPTIAAGQSAITVTGSQAVQAAPGPIQGLAVAAHARVIDQLFADLSGALSDRL